MKDYVTSVIETSQYLISRLEKLPEVGLITGTGLGDVADSINVDFSIDYKNIPHFPTAGVVSHHGRLVFGEMKHRYLMAMQGRVHLYEGYSSREVTFPVRVMQTLGVKRLILLNASGGLNPDFNPGDIMIISDHVNLTGSNPLVGPNIDHWGPRFPDMTEAYCKTLSKCAEKAASDAEIRVKRGVYAGLKGPSLETPAEVRFLRNIGCDAVGFSTTQEVISANHANMKVLGLSIITNVHDPDHPTPANVDGILKVAKASAPNVITLVERLLKNMGV